jgi:hypothetical protein
MCNDNIKMNLTKKGSERVNSSAPTEDRVQRRSLVSAVWNLPALLPETEVVKIKLPLGLTQHHAMKKYWGSGGTALRILNLGTKWR